ncbi:MAG: hypothetical protein MRJ52_13460 [Nitrosomonas sp.]|nr:hypothetical protein [Nitrosomonas sp.]
MASPKSASKWSFGRKYFQQGRKTHQNPCWLNIFTLPVAPATALVLLRRFLRRKSEFCNIYAHRFPHIDRFLPDCFGNRAEETHLEKMDNPDLQFLRAKNRTQTAAKKSPALTIASRIKTISTATGKAP